MKINRFKVFLYLGLFLAPFLSIFGYFSLQVINTLTAYESIVTIYSALNNASLFALFSITLIVTTFTIVVLLTGKSLRWMPKIILFILSGMVLISFIAGWTMTTITKKELDEKGYIECTSEREFALKYSS
ncbi:hypothetical protein [Vibrio anguillarum]|nr:hypothetical protein [Vibrio anguillarum]MBT2967514.1 hypothetical protein [Vibrio anguillarum]